MLNYLGDYFSSFIPAVNASGQIIRGKDITITIYKADDSFFLVYHIRITLNLKIDEQWCGLRRGYERLVSVRYHWIGQFAKDHEH